MEFRISGQPIIEALQGPVAKLRVSVVVELRKSHPGEGAAYLLDIKPRFDFLGITIPQVLEESGIQPGTDMAQMGGSQLRYLLVLPRDLLRDIENARKDDVPVSISLQALCLMSIQPPPGTHPQPFPQVQYANHAMDISENKWLGLLEKLGYSSSWVIEIPKPMLEGWDQTASFLAKAEERISSHDPEGAIAQCRAAWKSIEPLLKENWPSLAVEINRGSKKEENQPEKSERIDAVWKDLLKFSNTGSHPESYNATMSDAVLAYQMTSSLMAYLSRKVTDSEKRKEL